MLGGCFICDRFGAGLAGDGDQACSPYVAATQSLRQNFNYQAALAVRCFVIGSTPIYPPFSILPMVKALERVIARLRGAKTDCLYRVCERSGAILEGSSHPSQRPFGVKSWGTKKMREAGLFAAGGASLASSKARKSSRTMVTSPLLSGGTRSGKTRGSVIPTLLPVHSILVLDLRNELHSGDGRVDFRGTAGCKRARLGPLSVCADGRSLGPPQPPR